MANERIVALSHQLRDSGVAVSVRSTKTATEVWDLFKYEKDMDDMKTALKSVYIKDNNDEKKFDKVFEEIFIEDDKSDNAKDRRELFEQYDDSNDDPSIHPEDIMGKPSQQESDINIETMMPPDFDPSQLTKNKVHEKDLLKTDIGNINTFDERILDLCRKLGKKIANQRSTRRKRMESNNVDMPRTIRRNLKNGGKLIKLYNSKPVIRKNKHVFLSDVSGSCDWISSWFFAIIYGCQRSFDKITTYEFDNQLIETTQALNSESYLDSYQSITMQRMRRGMIHGTSDMARSFKQFNKNANLNHRSIVIILTDCRDWNGKREEGVLESAKYLKEIVKRSSKVMILNPESHKRWNTPTSCVRDYIDAGAEVHEIKNLENLSNLISKL